MTTDSYLSADDMEFIANFRPEYNDISFEHFSDASSFLFDDNEVATVASGEKEMELEPTPIAQNGVVVVKKVPASARPWRRDGSFLDSLRSLLDDEKSLSLSGAGTPPACTNTAPLSVSSWKNATFTTNDCTDRMTTSPVSFYDNTTLARRRSNDMKSIGVVSISGEDELTPSGTDGLVKTDQMTSPSLSAFRWGHVEQWNHRYKELEDFQKEYGHCLVPLNWSKNPSLAHWVKRQRYQFRMIREGKHSTLTEDRRHALESLGFVWDSHAAGWEERWNELQKFKENHGHCNVPKKYPPNQPLAVWVKCQRRQFKLFSQGQNSNMTRGRIAKLQQLGFVFDPRSKSRRTGSYL